MRVVQSLFSHRSKIHRFNSYSSLVFDRQSITENSRSFNLVTMEIEYLRLVYAVVAIGILAVIFGRRRRAVWPPGPVGLPFVGHLFYFGKDTLDKLRDFHDKYGKTFYLKMGAQDVVM